MTKTVPTTLAQDAVRRLAVDAVSNRAALDELLARTARLRRRLAGMAILGRELDPSFSIDDVMQEVALQVVLSIRSYDPARGPLGPWIAGVTRNVVIKRSRARPGVPSLRTAFDAPQANYVALFQTLKSPLITGQERSILTLLATGHTAREIAAAVGISTQAASKRIQRLRARLDDHHS